MDDCSDDLSPDVLYIVPREYRTHSELFIDSSQIDITREPVLIVHYGEVDDYLRVNDDITIKINSDVTSISTFEQVCKQIHKIARQDLFMHNIDLADLRQFAQSCNEFYGFDSESEAREFSKNNSVKSLLIFPVGEYGQDEYMGIIERFESYNENCEYLSTTPMLEPGVEVRTISILGM